MIQTQEAAYKMLTKIDWISTLRNWAIVNATILMGYWSSIETMFVDWKFNWTDIRQMITISVFSFALFTIKRYFTGTKK